MSRKLVKLPDISESVIAGKIADGKNHWDILAEFYKELGWNPETHLLDPVKVKLNVMEHQVFFDRVIELGQTSDERLDIGFMMMNSGPSQDDSVPDGKVWLQKGWIEYCPDEEAV